MSAEPFTLSEFLLYLAAIPPEGDQRIPPLNVLSKELGLSVATLREQLEEARSMGLVEVKPRAGIRKLPFDFAAAIRPGLLYAVHSKSIFYHQFSNLRKHLEAAYFIEAAQLLTLSDVNQLTDLVSEAQKKINSFPTQNLVTEHRQFHLLIYRRLENEYLLGVLRAFWDIYHISGMEIYPEIHYLERVWYYHASIVDQIRAKNFSQGLAILMEHMDMLSQREKSLPKLNFE